MPSKTAPRGAPALQAPLLPVEAASSEEAEDKALATAFAGGQEFAESYLYCYRDERLNKLVVGPNVDFVRQLVDRVVNRAGRADLDISEQQPVVEHFQREGKAWVRVVTCAVDRKTDKRKWAVVEEPYVNRHTAYAALQKAERRALEGHQAYDRKRVAREIQRMLRRSGLDPTDFVVAGSMGRSEWAALFARARANGVAPEAVRAAVRDKVGKGLSELGNPEEVAAAAAAVDALVATVAADQQSPGESRAEAGAPPPNDADRLLAVCRDYIAKLGLARESTAWLWARVGSPQKTVGDYSRMARALQYLAVGYTKERAVEHAILEVPRTVAP